jgi:hypothetical protein
MSNEPINPDSAKGLQPGKPRRKAGVVSVLLPLVVALLSVVAQWFNAFRPFEGPEPNPLDPTAGGIAWALLILSVAIFLIVAFYSMTLATRRGRFWVIGAVIAIAAGLLLIAFAAWLALVVNRILFIPLPPIWVGGLSFLAVELACILV